jgi:hypothetical protein
MNQFIFLFRGGDASKMDFSPEEMQQHMQKWGVWMNGLAERGILKGGEPLKKQGKVVKLEGTEKIVTDGPFTETKELIGGYLLINAENLEAACEIAKGCPIYENHGKVEVREISKMGGE